MRVEINEPGQMEFGELGNGTVFRSGVGVYIKIAGCTAGSNSINAFDLRSGGLAVFQTKTMVLPSHDAHVVLGEPKPEPRPERFRRARPVVMEINAERIRQINEEGHEEEYDDAYEKGELRAAAGAYVTSGIGGLWPISGPPLSWPFNEKWWKPKNARRDLIRAAALIVAEIERLDRRAKAEQTRIDDED